MLWLQLTRALTAEECCSGTYRQYDHQSKKTQLQSVKPIVLFHLSVLSLMIHYHHPLPAIPCSRYLCPHRNTSNGGNSATSAATNATPAFSFVIVEIYNDNGFNRSVLRNTAGCSIGFQYSRKSSTMTDIIPGIPSGIPIRQKICHSFAPSSLAASITSFDSFEKKRYIMKTGKRRTDTRQNQCPQGINHPHPV